MVNMVVMQIDAREGTFPTVGMTLTTVDPDHDLDRFRRDLEKVRKFVRRRLGKEVGFLQFIEWTTGHASTSGGHRRVHTHALLKRADVAAAEALEGELREMWLARTGANRIEMRELRCAAGATAYLAPHHAKREQAAPLDLHHVRRFRASRNYFDRPVSELRLDAKEIVKDQRLVAAIKAATSYELLAEYESLQIADEVLADALAMARAEAEAGGQVVRVQRFPETWSDDGEPATWVLEVLGPYEPGM